MNKKRKLLIASTAAAVAVFAAAGVTLAVTLTDNTGSGSITAGDVNITTKATNVKVYSAVKASAGDSDTFTYDGVAYKYEQGIIADSAINFSHGGGVSYTGKSITIDKILPGDKVEFDIEVTSASTVSFYYRAELHVNASAGANLLNQLDFSVDELDILRYDVEGQPVNTTAPVVVTDWKPYGSDQASIEKVHVTIAMPIEVSKGQGETVTFEYTARAEQIPEEVPPAAEIKVGDSTESFDSLGEAVEYAEEHNVSEITIKDGVLEEGNIRVTRAIHFKGEKGENDKKPVIKSGIFTIAEGSAATFTDIEFNGTSYIDVSESTALTLNDCIVNISAIKYYDKSTRSFLSDAAFIVSGSSTIPVRLKLNNNKFVSDKGAAICLRSNLRDGSEFVGNVFGSEFGAYNGSAVLMIGGAESGATVKLDGNTMYGKLPVSLGGKSGVRYTVVSTGNNAYGLNTYEFVGGSSAAAFLDNGSKVNETAITCKQIGSGILFGAVDVVLGAQNRISSGKVTLSANIKPGDFYTNFVSAGTLSHNAIELYEDGVLYAYLNSSSSNAGYVVDTIQ